MPSAQAADVYCANVLNVSARRSILIILHADARLISQNNIQTALTQRNFTKSTSRLFSFLIANINEYFFTITRIFFTTGAFLC
jgi:hypothetical protein